jgi:uncharacterized phage protein gp47/JayE
VPADFSKYINLRSFDASPTEVYLDSIDYARLVLPEFTLRQGTPEDAIMQAVSYISALNIAAINRLPDRLMSGILGMLGVEIDDGTQAFIDVRFTGIDYDATSIPQGTILRYDYEFLGEQESVYFETVEEGIIDAVVYTGTENLPSVVVECRSLDVGELLPLTAGLDMIIDSPVSNVLEAKIESIVSNGTNQEISEDYLNRAVQYLGSLSSALVKASQVEGYVLSNFVGTVSRCKTYDLTNYDSGMQWSDPDETGYVTVFVYGINAQLLSDQKIDILVAIQDRTVAGLEVFVVDVNEVELSVELEATYSSEYESAVVEGNIKSVLASTFSPNNYRFTDKIRKSEFISAVSAVPGVIYVESLDVSVGSGPATITVGGDVSFSLKGTLPAIPITEITTTLTSSDQ